MLFLIHFHLLTFLLHDLLICITLERAKVQIDLVDLLPLSLALLGQIVNYFINFI